MSVWAVCIGDLVLHLFKEWEDAQAYIDRQEVKDAVELLVPRTPLTLRLRMMKVQ